MNIRVVYKKKSTYMSMNALKQSYFFMAAKCLPCSFHTKLHQFLFLFEQEEALYKYPISTYPDVNDITVAVDPFQRLFNVVLRWQKAEKKLVDFLVTS